MTTGGAGTEGGASTMMPGSASLGPPTVLAAEMVGPQNGVGGARAHVVVMTLPSGCVVTEGFGVAPGGTFGLAGAGGPGACWGGGAVVWVGVDPVGQGRLRTGAGSVGTGVESVAMARTGLAARTAATATVRSAVKLRRTGGRGRVEALRAQVDGDMTGAAYVIRCVRGRVVTGRTPA